MVCLRSRSGHTADDVKRAALIELRDEIRARAEIEIRVSKGSARRGVHLHRRVDRVADLDGSGRLDLEHGVDRIDALLGDEHLAAHVLLGAGGSGIVHRRGDGVELPFRNVGGNNELKLTGVIGASRSEIALEDADRYARSGSARGQREVVGLRGRSGHAADDIERAALIELRDEIRARAEVQIGIGKGSARRGVHLHRCIDRVAVLDGGGRLDLEHGVDRVRALLGDEHLAAHVLLSHRRGGIAHRRGNCRFRRGGRLRRRRRLLRRGSLGRFGHRRRRGRGSCLRSGRGLRRGGGRRSRSRFRRRRGRGLRGRRHGACAAGVVRSERRDNIPQRQAGHEQQHNDPGHCFVHIDALLNDLMGKSRKNSDAPPGKTKSEQPIGCSDGVFRIIAF